MRALLTVATACVLVVAATGCDKTRSDPPLKPVADVGTAATTPPPPIVDASVPSAASVLPSGSDAGKSASSAPPGKEMTRAEESASMPMTGQNNDHSAPQNSAKRASGP